MTDIFSHLITLTIGLFFGGIGKILFERYKFLQKRTILINALSGEIEAIEKSLSSSEMMSLLRESAKTKSHYITPGCPEKKDYIFERCKDDIGYLPSALVHKIVFFYNRMNSIRVTENFFCSISTKELEGLSSQNLANIYLELADDMEKNVILAKELNTEICKIPDKNFLLFFKIN